MERSENPLDNKILISAKRLRKIGFVSIILTMLISSLALLGWYLNISQLKYILPTSHPMYPKAGLGFLLCSFALLLFNSKKNQRSNFFVAQIFSSLTLIIGSWTLIEYALGKVLLIGQEGPYWVPQDPSKYFQPSPETAFCLILSSSGILFMNSTSSRWKTFSEASILLSGGVALLSIAGFLTGANSLYSIVLPANAVGMSLQTATAFICLSVGTLCFIPREGVLSIFASDSPGGNIARKLVLIVLFMPMGIEFIVGALVNIGIVNPTFRQSLAIVSIFSLFIFLSWMTARKIDSVDSERRKLELNLKESEEKYRSLIELAPESIFIADTTGKYVEVNEAACKLLKFSKEEIIGKTIIDLIPSSEKKRLEDSKKYLQGSGNAEIAEWKLKKGDGHFVDVEINAKILSHNRWVAFVRNIEDRKKNERRERILALLGKELPEILDMRECLKRAARIITNEIGDWSTVNLINENSQSEQLIVYHRNPNKTDVANELMNLPVTSMVHDRINEVIANKEGLLLLKKDFSLFLDEVLQSDRHKLYERLGLFSVCHIPLISRGRAFGLFSLVNAERDFDKDEFDLVKLIVEQVSLIADNAYLYEESIKASQAREDLMAIVSHDLKNPLAVIDLDSQNLKRLIAGNKNIGELKELLIKISHRMDSSVKRSLTLISDLLTFAKIESGGLVLKKSKLDLSVLIEETIDNHHLIAQDKRVQLSSIVEEPHLVIKVDHSKILQVLGNLIGNALKFTESGGTIQIRVSSKMKEEILFQITDTGPGIKEEELQHIFDRYWQPKRTQAQGSGLGLAIAKGIVEAHGGRIWAESVFGKGSSFFFTIPSPPIQEKVLNQRSYHENI